MKQASAIWFLLLCVLSSCGSAQKKRAGELDWDDLVSHRQHYEATPIPSGSLVNANSGSNAVDSPEGAKTGMVKSRSQGPTLEQLAAGFQMEKPVRYEGGVYGKKGHIPVFAARLADIPDYDRLYWVMVKVLSEKYGCFMKRKASTHNQVMVECRDKRRVVLHRNRGDGWIQFYGRQYNADGKEVVIRDHKAFVLE